MLVKDINDIEHFYSNKVSSMHAIVSYKIDYLNKKHLINYSNFLFFVFT